MRYQNMYPPYVSVAERQAKARKMAEKLQKKSGPLNPVCVSGRTIAKSWWGKSWNQNLERYADYANRIGRGRSYVCNGMVLDLQIQPETITAIVAGSGSTPYKITIKIKPVPGDAWKRLMRDAAGQIESLAALLEGRFPESLKTLMFAREAGLFPEPKEIKFECSCPDWAYMCKHVAAVLYGVGARLDDDPKLFFTLRGVNINDLIGDVARTETQKLLKRQTGYSPRIIQPSDSRLLDIQALFGIDLVGASPPKSPVPVPEKSDRSKKKSKPVAVKRKPAPKRRKAAVS
ncbi:MAG: SWIM zinc finger family protein [Desulfatirhabdiaceae bacterium]